MHGVVVENKATHPINPNLTMRKIITTQQHFILQFTYSPQIIKAVKQLPERKFHYGNKSWSVPRQYENHVSELAVRFHFVWDKHNEPAPKVNNVIPDLPELKVDIPLKMQLYPYQKQGTAYGIEKRKIINGDQPGLGKTAQSIATVSAADMFPCLVICPNSLKLNWEREWQMWTNHRPIILNDSIKRTWPYFHESGMANVFIVNYESLKKYFVVDINQPEGKPLRLNHIQFNENIKIFKSVIVDESHRVKDLKTQQTKFTKGICIGKEMVMLLTGTPVVNKPQDLVSQLGIIDMMEKFGGYSGFMRRYVNDDRYLHELNYILRQNCFVRREKKDVLKELPDKVRQIVSTGITTRKEYQDAEADLEDYLKRYRKATDAQVQKSLKGEIMVRIGVLKNISARGKVKDVIEYVQDIVESGEKIILFVHLKEVAQMLKKFFPAAVTILGEDKTQDRQASIDQFQNDKRTQIIICSIKAAGVGITLTASSRVAFVELPWHPADCEQCEDRAHRIGQKDSVQATYFLGKDTIDEWIYQVIEEKRHISNTITGSREVVETSVMDSIINIMLKNKV